MSKYPSINKSEQNGYTHINRFEVCNFYYTEELIAPHIIIVGATMKY
jgi:hypothetical protein